ncbi:MAG TPA: 3-deoxy-D-manno-octulosonic acid transferase, partial [Candidatus Limnocylindrales bacterium]|nr:3-deoxy-D-manno-octulosonic acid transferase [Candidatus Limnocylindrales bacterium]
AFGMYLLYRILTAAGILILAPYYALRGWRRNDRSGALRERLGFLPREISARASADSGAIWVHAVSVGEVLAAVPLVAGLKQRYPTRAVFISTTTETGRRLARERLLSADGIFYFPLDWAVAVRRALGAIRPAAVIVMETEIWPNFLREARRGGVPVIFANARISERSFARFERWKFIVGEFFAQALADAAVFLAQSDEDAKRLAEMGAPDERIEITGNLKYDAEPPVLGAFGEWLCNQIQQQERWPVVMAGSVVEGEEEAVLAAYDLVQRQWRRALMVLAPRKPDRFDEAARIVELDGWNVVRRSRLDQSVPLDENADVLVLDSIGELSALYSIADAVFVGGSLAASGGHNILEPAWFGKPPVFGLSMENFREMADQFLSARAGIQVNSGPMLGKVWVQLIEDSATRARMGKAAQELSGRNRGAAARTLARIAEILDRKGTAA